MATLEEIINGLGVNGYYANQEGSTNLSLGDMGKSSAQEYKNMIDAFNAPVEVLYDNNIPLDNPFQAYGGRISTGFPMSNTEALNLGATLQGFNNPYESQSLAPIGVDATYQSGNTSYGMTYDQLSPEEKRLLFSITQEF